jgi:hypothetical protein
VAEPVQVLQGEGHAPAVVEDHLALGVPAAQPVADRHHRKGLGHLRPQRRRRVERLHDEAVHALIA